MAKFVMTEDERNTWDWNALYLEDTGFSNAQVAKLLGYANPEGYRVARQEGRSPSKKTYDAMLELVAKVEKGELKPGKAVKVAAPAEPKQVAAPQPAQPAEVTPMFATTLECFEAAQRDIDKAIKKLEAGWNVARPILRPGIQEAIRKLRDVKKDYLAL